MVVLAVFSGAFEFVVSFISFLMSSELAFVIIVVVVEVEVVELEVVELW